MKSCILFCRVSTSKQDWERQRLSLLDMAHKEGYTDDNIKVVGNHESGYKLLLEERKGLNDLFKHIDSGKIDCVFVWEISRLARKPKILYEIRDRLQEKGVQLICEKPSFRLLEPDLKTIDSMANIVFAIFGALAEQEQFIRKARFEDGKSKNAAKQRYNGGNIPYGYRLNDDKTFDIDENQADVIRDIFNLYEEGYSTTKLVRELRTRYGDPHITLSFVNNILNNELLTGRTHKTKEVECKIHGEIRTWHLYARSYPQIITERQYDRCREIASTNNTNASKTKYIYYAEKLLRCPECGKVMIGVANRGYYKCYDATNPNRELNGQPEKTRCRNKSTISINVIDSILWDAAAHAEVFRVAMETKTKEQEYKTEIALLRKKVKVCQERIHSVEEKIERANELYIEGTISKEKLVDKTIAINNDKNEIIQEINEYEDRIYQLQQITRSLSTDGPLKSLIQSYKTVKGKSNSTTDVQGWRELNSAIFSITNDEQRKEIVRRHVEKITFDDVETTYQYAKSAKKVRVRRVKVYYNDSNIPCDIYTVIPNCGDGSHVYHANSVSSIRKFQKPIPIIKRYTNKNREKNRALAKAIRQEEQCRKMEGMLTIQDIMGITGWAYGKVKYAISQKGLSAEKQGKVYLISKSNWENWRKKNMPAS